MSEPAPSPGQDLDLNQTHSPLRQAFDELQAAYLADPLPPVTARRGWLTALLQMVREAADDVTRAASDDFGGRSIHESKLSEVWLTVSQLQYLIAHFESWVQPRPAHVQWALLFGRAEVFPQPKGVVGIIAPWNYPFMLPVEQLAGALAAGNRVLLKLSEHTPATSALLQARLQAVLPPDVVRVFTGGADEGQELSALPLDHLLFTGGNAVGQQVYQAAAKNLVPVSLELGGKSPAILHESYPLERFAKSIISGKCFSAGQGCVAPDYLLVPKGFETKVETALAARFKESYPTLRDNPDYSAVAGARRRERLCALLDDAVAKGARAVELNPGNENTRGEDFSRSQKLPLTLLFDVPPDARVMQEEIFGPLLPVVACESVEEAMRYVNARPRPLALYYFDDDLQRQNQVIRGTVSGGVTINDTLLHFLCDGLPRGTTGQSGLGAYHGWASFDAFSHKKSVFRQSRLNGIDLLRPPYRSRIEWILRLLIGR